MKTILKVSRALPALSLALCLVSPDAQGFQSCLTTFQNTYPASATDGAGCQVCHNTSGGSGFNPYGAAMRDSVSPFNCAAALAAIEGQDSDADNGSFSNLAEIDAGTQPGWCVFAPGGPAPRRLPRRRVRRSTRILRTSCR